MSLDVPETARLFAMVNEVGADAMISMITAKYHYLFWRPVTAIDPMSVIERRLRPGAGPDDGNPLTDEQTPWSPLVTTPNHPEYPSAHSTITSAMRRCSRTLLGTDQLDIDVQGTPDSR